MAYATIAGWIWILMAFYKTLRLPLFDYDLWWHLATGRLIVENHVFPKVDLFSHTLAGTPWINFEWLSQIILFGVVKYCGLQFLLFFKVGLGLLIIASLIFLIRKFGGQGPYLLFAVFLSFTTLRSRLYERTELATLLLMPTILWILSSVRIDTKNISVKRSWLFLILMVLWTNLHGGFIYGIGATFLLMIGARWSGMTKESISFFDRAFVFSLIAMVINPYGVRIVDVFVDHALQLHAPAIIEEWATPTLKSNPGFWLLFFLGAGGLIIGFLKRRPEAKFWGPVVLVFMLWGARHERNAAYLPFFVLPYLANLASQLKEETWSVKLNQLKPLLQILCFVPLMFLWPQIRKSISTMTIQDNRFPFGACRFIKERNIQGTMYNTYHLGGVIEWSLGLSHKVFMDGRYIFHPLLVHHSQFDNALFRKADGTEWQAFLKSYGVDYAIVDHGAFMIPSQGKAPFPFAWANLVFPRANWALVYWDDASLVFLKRIPKFSSTIKQYEYNNVWPYNLDQMRFLLQSKTILPANIKVELDRQQKESPISLIREEIRKLIQP